MPNKASHPVLISGQFSVWRPIGNVGFRKEDSPGKGVSL